MITDNELKSEMSIDEWRNLSKNEKSRREELLKNVCTCGKWKSEKAEFCDFCETMISQYETKSGAGCTCDERL